MRGREVVALPTWQALDSPVIEGDCVAVMRAMPARSVDAVVCDPPYGIAFMGKAWDRPTVGPRRRGSDPAVEFQRWCSVWATEAYRVLKPGAHLLAFGGTRTYHRLACGLEDAGFEIRDCILWLYGEGFPKSFDVARAIDEQLGVEREVVGRGSGGIRTAFAYDAAERTQEFDLTVATSPKAREWAGWATTLKPAFEPVVVARRPLEGTIASNVLEHGTGALNIAAARIPSSGGGPGRWPANVAFDEAAAAMLDEQSGESRSRRSERRARSGEYGWGLTSSGETHDDEGGASRFFYVAKAHPNERDAGLEGFRRRRPGRIIGREDESPDGRLAVTRNLHPTVKPIGFMSWLLQLVTPPDGLVVDLFAGSASTVCAGFVAGVPVVGIEREPEYVAIGRARARWWAAQPRDIDPVAVARAAVRRIDVADAGQLEIFPGEAAA